MILNPLEPYTLPSLWNEIAQRIANEFQRKLFAKIMPHIKKTTLDYLITFDMTP